MRRSTAFMSATLLRYQHVLQSSISRQEVKNLLLVQSDGLVGREREIASACALLRRPDVRLLTISGPGGVGKTRLALHVSSLLAENFQAGVRCVSLASIDDPALLIPVIAQELGFVESREEPLSTRIEGYLRDNPLLLLLDNFEQVIAASSIVTDLLSACPGLKILVTSREVLHIRIEHELIVPPLALPDLKQLPDNEQLLQYAAVALFVQRAEMVKPGFQLTPINARTVVEICVRLDGLPLAIELAAAWIKLLPPHMLLARLESCLQILTNGARDLPMRQQTLRNTLTWSYDLLNPKEQLIFRSLSVFVHGCTLEAAENICIAFDDGIVNVLEVIASLVDKNLLHQVETADGGMRLLMLETVHEYGLECLELKGESDAVCKTHALYYLKLAEKAEPEIRKGQQVVWLDSLEQEYDNLRTAVRWSLEQKEIELTLRFCGALCSFWLIRNHQKEGYKLVEKALGECESEEVSVVTRAKAFYTSGVLAERQGRHARSLECLQESLTLYQSLNDERGIASVLNKLGNAMVRKSSFEARSLYQKSLALARKQNDIFTTIDVLLSLADEAVPLEDFTRAREIFEESLEYSKVVEDKRSIAICLEGLGQITNREGNYGEAQILLKESLSLYREVGDRVGIAFTLIPLGTAILYQGDIQTAQKILEESLTVSKELGNRNKIANYLGNLGEVALSEKGENTSAPRTLLEESLAIFREIGNEQGIASKLFALGCMECVQGTFTAALQFLGEGLILFKRLDNRAQIASSLNMLGHVYAHRGEYKFARTYMEESLVITREIEDYRFLSSRLSQLGLVILNEGNCAEVRPLLEESLAIAKEIEDRRYIADALGIMGLLYLNEKNYALAQVHFDESLALAREVGDRYLIGYRVADSGLLALHQKNGTKARPLIEEGLAASIEAGNRWFIASCLERMGEVAITQDQFLWATQLWGAAAAMRDAIGAPVPPIEQEFYEDVLAAARVQLGESAFLSAWKIGYTMTPEQVISSSIDESLFPDMHRTQLEQALPASLSVSTARSAPGPAHPFAALSVLKAFTRREIEVLQLLVQGASNREIADRLVISEGTVKKHVSNICGKLGVQSRTQVVARALSL